MRLLLGSSPERAIDAVGETAYRTHFGMLCSPRDKKSPATTAAQGVVWAADNFAFTDWNPKRFLDMLYRYQPYQENCIFVAAPDVVQNAQRTAVKFEVWEPLIHDLGYPVALVAQDGLEHCVIPWQRFEALFIGGGVRRGNYPWR